MCTLDRSPILTSIIICVQRLREWSDTAVRRHLLERLVLSCGHDLIASLWLLCRSCTLSQLPPSFMFYPWLYALNLRSLNNNICSRTTMG